MSQSDIQRIAVAVAAGRTPTVYFTAAAEMMEEGRSGKVVAVAETSQPDPLHVRPSRSNDTLAFSPNELTLTKPVRRTRASPRPGKARSSEVQGRNSGSSTASETVS
ncbi:hypothetical protein [Nocardia suismassiliense]|uniref:hypothetical protein n=1 Tax=Nocardia suismassiliense TaxID=2077092 RepID=UPI000D1E9725|nr:hypothetical protein [Nocardia suismassiliense]